MQNFRNYYDILGVTHTATADEVKRSFRRLARQCHPDLNPGNKSAEEQFKSISEAYEILSDSDRRARYDQFSRYWKQKGFQSTPSRRTSKGWSSRPSGGMGNDVDYGQFPDFNTFVEELLGKTPTSKSQKRYSRTTVTRRVVPSRGSDTPPQSSPPSRSKTWERPPNRSIQTSPRNNGMAATGSAGTTAMAPSPLRDYRPGMTKTAYTIPAKPKRRDVEAKLVIPLEKAYQGGVERVQMEGGRMVEVEMPRGLVTGQQVRLRGQGIGGGDLYLAIEVLPHAFFKLKGSDVHCCLAITAVEATLGVPVQVPTLDGPVEMKLPPGVASGKCLRLANKGYWTVDGTRGDQIVALEVRIPPQITAAERKLYEQIYGMESFKPRS